jgi:hypothetical protein
VKARVCLLLLLASSGHSPLPMSPLRAQSARALPPSRSWSCLTASVAAAQGFQSASLDAACAVPASRPALHFAPAGAVRVAEPILMSRPPAALTAAVAGADVTLTWTMPGGADGTASHLLEAGSRSGGSDLVNADIRSSAPALTISNVPPGIYFLRVRARNASGTSAASNEIAITIPADCLNPPGAPSGLAAAVSGATVTLNWQATGIGCPATSYLIEAGSGSGLANLASFSTGNAATSFTATSVPGATYYVRVKATNAAGSSSASHEVSFSVGTGPCTTPPAAPSAFTASVTATIVVLTWSAPSGAPSTYVVEAGSTTGATNLVVSDTGGAATSLTATAAPGTYYARLRARNACGTSAPSNEIVIVVIAGSTHDAVLQATFNGVEDTGDPSADATIAAGPSSLVIARNTWITIRDKSGALIATKRMADFVASVHVAGGFITDPYVLFDPDSERFFVANSDHVMDPTCVPGACVGNALIAVSKTATPTTLDASDWYFYALDQTIDMTTQGTTKTAKWGDFHFMSVVGNTLAFSMSMVDFSAEITATMKIRLLDKSALVSGRPVTSWADFVGLNDTTLPVITFGNPGGVLLVAAHPCGFQISGITNPLSPVITTRTITTCPDDPATFNAPRLAEQPGGAPPISVPGPKQQYVYRDGSLWIAEPLPHNWGSGIVTAIHWAQIDMRGWPDNLKVVQSGTFGIDGIAHFVPAIMVDAANNMAIVYERSSRNEFVSAYYTWRLATDPPGTLRPGSLLKAGVSTYTQLDPVINRFVDFLGSALDPRDGSIWMLGKYAQASKGSPETQSGRSGTWVGHLVFP